jgi:hypothetical protein
MKRLDAFKPILLLLFSILLLSFDASPEPCLPHRVPVAGLTGQEGWRFLLENSPTTREPSALEAILDLVKVSCRDSALSTESQHHSIPGGGLLSSLGFNWIAIAPIKQKVVGTLAQPVELYDGPGEELDLNLDLIPHLATHVNQLVTGLEATHQSGRSMSHCLHAKDPKGPEGLRFDRESFYAIGCELTLPEKAWPVVGATLLENLNAGADAAGHSLQTLQSVGLYGPWVMDCNHNCRPEIHPFQWMWWLGSTPQGEPLWNVMLTADGSGRFEDWESEILEGEIRLPIAWMKGALVQRIKLEIQYWDGWHMGAWNNQVKEMACSFEDGTLARVQVAYPFHPLAPLEIGFEQDQQRISGVCTGWLRLGVKTQEHFSARVVML